MADEPERKAGPLLSWLTGNFNAPTLLAVGGIAYAVLNGNIQQERDIAEIKRTRAEQAAATDKRFDGADKRFDGIEDSLKTVNQQNLPYRITVVEGEVKATNGRIDELIRQMNAGLAALRDLNVSQTDLMRRDIGALAGDVRVLSTKLDGVMTPQRRPAYIPPSEDPQIDPPVYRATIPERTLR